MTNRAPTRQSTRQFLFLQGLAGPFFSLLGRALLGAGHGVHRINFHGGDKLCWHLPGAVDYRGGTAGWPGFLEQMLASRGITDIVLFGDCRPLHRTAIAVARSLQIQVHVYEEGYIRPDFVTLEVGGVNGHSSLPRDPDYYLEAARTLPPLAEMPAVPSSFSRRAREDMVYNLGALALTPLFPGYRTHRPWHVLVEYAGWAARLARRSADRRRSAATLQAMKADGRPYFVFPLQLDCDYQIRTHSSFVGMRPAIETVLGSFAAHAPADTLLAVKAHPLDNGLKNWRKLTLAVAAQFGVEDRIVFLEEADIALLVWSARGVVTVNSTTGTLSLKCGVPTVVLGQAIYDIPRITHQDGLDRFWTNPTPPDMEAFDAFRRVLVDRCLVHGGYFSDEGLARLVDASMRRLEAAARLGARAGLHNAAPVGQAAALPGAIAAARG